MADGSPYVIPPNYNTQLNPIDELAFRSWVAANNVPFNANAPVSDYDMRGFYQGLIGGNPHAQTGINQNDNQLHFSDFYKTPQHQSFSNESRYAGPTAPQWLNDSQLGYPNGRVVYDEKAPQTLFGLLAGRPPQNPATQPGSILSQLVNFK